MFTSRANIQGRIDIYVNTGKASYFVSEGVWEECEEVASRQRTFSIRPSCFVRHGEDGQLCFWYME